MKLLAAPLLLAIVGGACARNAPIMIIVPEQGTRYVNEAPTDPRCRQWGVTMDDRGNLQQVWICPAEPPPYVSTRPPRA